MKKRTCQHCAYAGPVRNGDPDELICANCPLAPGELVRIRPDGACPNFRAKPRPPRRFPRTSPLALPEPPNDQIRYIPLTRGLFATVDAADYPELSKHKWIATVMRNSTYATRSRNGRTIYMHREIMQPPPGMVVDHIDHNGVNNSRDNLRVCTRQQNSWNSPGPGNPSGYKGVWHNPKSGRYKAGIIFDGRPICLGSFDDPAEAARVRDRKALELQGPYAYINLPDDLAPGPLPPDPNHPERPMTITGPYGYLRCPPYLPRLPLGIAAPDAGPWGTSRIIRIAAAALARNPGMSLRGA